jgi:hypothetical protein
MSDLAGAVVLLRTLVDIRDGYLYSLFARLPVSFSPKIDTRIYGVSGDADGVHAVVWVAATRPDGREVTWSVSFDSGPATATASVEVDGENGSRTVFEEVRNLEDVEDAATQLMDLAALVATRTEFLT